MAKSLRSKSMRKARAIKREQVFKPVEDARTARLSEKLQSIPITNMPLESAAEVVAEVEMGNLNKKKISASAKVLKNARPYAKKNRRHDKKNKEFNVYGLSDKEIKFF